MDMIKGLNKQNNWYKFSRPAFSFDLKNSTESCNETMIVLK